MPGATGIAENVAAIRARLEAAGGGGITLVAVTKTRGWDAVEAAFAAGCDAVGENYVQEALAKITLPRQKRFAHVGSALGLAYCHDRDGARRASGNPRDALVDCLQPLGRWRHNRFA